MRQDGMGLVRTGSRRWCRQLPVCAQKPRQQLHRGVSKQKDMDKLLTYKGRGEPCHCLVPMASTGEPKRAGLTAPHGPARLLCSIRALTVPSSALAPRGGNFSLLLIKPKLTAASAHQVEEAIGIKTPSISQLSSFGRDQN